MACKVVGKTCKRDDERIPLGVDLTAFCENKWAAREIIAADEVKRPTLLKQTGFEYICTAPGQTGVSEPTWPKVIAGTVTDGAVTWACQAISNDSLAKTISTVEWVTDDFTVEDEDIVNTGGEQQASCFISGVVARGKYEVAAHVTFSDGHEEDFVIEVKVG